jgi:spore maturation protein CgeB
MRIAVFGLSISSAWGNGHATLLRGLFRALHEDGHSVDFFERNVPYYAAHRDLISAPYVNLHLYDKWEDVLPAARRTLDRADAGVVTSYCPDGAAASDIVLEAPASVRKLFYDMDTPVTLARLERGEDVDYVPQRGLSDFDLVLSYTGGQALEQLQTRLGARRAVPLYGWVDPEIHYRVTPEPKFTADLTYLGTHSPDRQNGFEELLLTPAKENDGFQFVVGGAMYSNVEGWPKNVRYFDHVAPPEHPAFYSSSAMTLNITRDAMARCGFCPSGRLFEAAACGTPVLSDWWEGLDLFFEPGKEILVGKSAADTLDALGRDSATLAAIGARAKERTLDCHTARMRAQRLVRWIEDPGQSEDAELLTSEVAGRSA